MDTGTFNLGDKIKFDGTNFDIDLSGKGIATDGQIVNLQNQITANALGIQAKVSTDQMNQAISISAANTVFKFSESGGLNLLLNGRPRQNLDSWYQSVAVTGDKNLRMCDFSENWRGEVFKSGLWWTGTYNAGEDWCCLFNSSLVDFKFATHKKYSISLIIYSDYSDRNVSIGILDGNGNNYVVFNNYTINQGYQEINFEFTPVISGNTPNLGIYLNTRGAFRFYIPWIVVKEGAVTYSWINGNEIREGSTTIDRSGLRVRNGNVVIENNAGTEVFKGDTEGNLNLLGRVTTRNDSNNRLLLEGNTLEGYLPNNYEPVYSCGMWQPEQQLLGFVSVGKTNARVTDYNGCLYMTPSPESSSDGCELTYSVKQYDGTNRTSGLWFTKAGNLFMRVMGGKYTLMLSTDGYFRPWAGNIDYGSNDSPINKIWYRNYAQVSDYRDKTDIEYVGNNPNVRSVKTSDLLLDDMYNYIRDDLKLVTFKYREHRDEEADDVQVGIIAQDVKDTKVGKYLVDSKDEDHLSVNTGNRISILEGALQKAIEKIELLEEKIKVLETIQNG